MADEPSTPPFTWLRVVELGSGLSLELAGMVLADFGAEVVTVLAPDAANSWGSGRRAMRQRGKRAVVADFDDPAGREQIDELLAGADVAIVALPPGKARAARLDAGSLRARNPHLLHCAITGFGTAGPYSDYAMHEHVVAMKAGRGAFYAGQAQRDGPVYPAAPVCSFAAAQAALQGIFAALHQREGGVPAGTVETSLVQALLAYDFFGWRDFQQPGKTFFRDAVMADGRRQRASALSYIVAPTADGHWLQFIQAAGHLFYRFMLAIGLEQLFLEERFMNLPNVDPVTQMEAWRTIVARIREKPFAEWMAILEGNDDVTVEVFRAPWEVPDHPQIAHNGDLAAVAGAATPADLQLAPLFEASATPGRAGGPPAPPEERIAWPGRTAALPVDRASHPLPLAGIKVVELARYYAAPYGVTCLAELGADVIKVEALEGESPFGGGISKTSQGKRSIAVDLKRPEGRRILEELIGRADVFVHNLRPGAIKRLDLDFAALSPANPRLIYVSSWGYGPDGPLAGHPAFDPMPGVVVGNAWRQAGGLLPPDPVTTRGLTFEEALDAARRSGLTNWGFGDPTTALVVATAVAAAILARDRSGKGQELSVTMLRANLYLAAELFPLEAAGEAGTEVCDGDVLGLSPGYRLYRAAGGTWVFLGCATPGEWARFRREADLDEGPAASLVPRLETFFSTRGADEWERRLTAAGIPCVRADGPETGEFSMTDAHMAANGFAVPATDSWGSYLRHGPLLRVDGQPRALPGSAALGEHTREILRDELGYSLEELDALTAARVVRG